MCRCVGENCVQLRKDVFAEFVGGGALGAKHFLVEVHELWFCDLACREVLLELLVPLLQLLGGELGPP